MHFVHNADRELGTELCRKCARFKPWKREKVVIRRHRVEVADDRLANWKFGIFQFNRIGLNPNEVLLKAGSVLLVNRYNENGTEECAEIPVMLNGTAHEIYCDIIRYYEDRLSNHPNLDKFKNLMVDGIFKIDDTHYGCNVILSVNMAATLYSQ
jgi:hypothetical protein